MYDLAIIGGGINGCGIARDAAGRGLSVFLCDQGDLGGGTSWASTKLIHGGLRYLETYEVGMVRKALRERRVLHGLAPHLIQPKTFILPHQPHLRPAWLIRLGLFFYDYLDWKSAFEKSRVIRLSGDILKEKFTRGFTYTDCCTDDNRLVIANAQDAARMGAIIAPYTPCNSASVKEGVWEIEAGGKAVRAGALVNATGPWAQKFVQNVLGRKSVQKLRLVKGSHMVVPKLFDHEEAYIFQLKDGRIVFAIPYENDFTLIGTTEEDYEDDPYRSVCSEEEISYLCDAVNGYFQRQISVDDVLWTYSGVRPLMADDTTNASKASRDYSLELETEDGAPLLHIWGGKLTTFRVLAEQVVDLLKPQGAWTKSSELPGAINPAELHEKLKKSHQWLPEKLRRRYVHAYGEQVFQILGEAQGLEDMGQHFGHDFYAAEVEYLMEREWARTAEDILWHRTKQGLHLSEKEQQALSVYIGGKS